MFILFAQYEGTWLAVGWMARICSVAKAHGQVTQRRGFTLPCWLRTQLQQLISKQLNQLLGHQSNSIIIAWSLSIPSSLHGKWHGLCCFSFPIQSCAPLTEWVLRPTDRLRVVSHWPTEYYTGLSHCPTLQGVVWLWAPVVSRTRHERYANCRRASSEMFECNIGLLLLVRIIIINVVGIGWLLLLSCMLGDFTLCLSICITYIICCM